MYFTLGIRVGFVFEVVTSYYYCSTYVVTSATSASRTTTWRRFQRHVLPTQHAHRSAGGDLQPQLRGVAAVVGSSLCGILKAHIYYRCLDETSHEIPELLPREPVRAREPRDLHDTTEPTI